MMHSCVLLYKLYDIMELIILRIELKICFEKSTLCAVITAT